MDFSSMRIAAQSWAEVEDYHGKRLERMDTPSTSCGDHEDTSHRLDDFTPRAPWHELDVPMPREIRLSFSHSRRRGLNREEFFRAVKAPFLFPILPSRRPTLRFGPEETPVCIICSSGLVPGNVCRELVGCGHCFHSQCVEGFFQVHSRCPVCRIRCRASSHSNRKVSVRRPCWTPDYDVELLSISDKVDRDRRKRMYILGGVRDCPPESRVFLRAALPTLLEENQEMLDSDGSLLSLCKFLFREKERRVLSSIPSWSSEMRKVAVTFSVSLLCAMSQQIAYVAELARLVRKKSSVTEMYTLRE